MVGIGTLMGQSTTFLNLILISLPQLDSCITTFRKYKAHQFQPQITLQGIFDQRRQAEHLESNVDNTLSWIWRDKLAKLSDEIAVRFYNHFFSLFIRWVCWKQSNACWICLFVDFVSLLILFTCWLNFLEKFVYLSCLFSCRGRLIVYLSILSVCQVWSFVKFDRLSSESFCQVCCFFFKLVKPV